MNDAGARLLYIVLLASSVGIVLVANQTAAVAGPCTEQIAQLEQQISASSPASSALAPQSAPTDTQSIGAQLHHQPTPGSVAQAENTATDDGTTAIDRAKKADDAGDAAGCNRAMADARRVYAIKN
jgi:hypothetical protein